MDKNDIKKVEVAANSLEALADNIEQLARAFFFLEHSRLNKKAILVLLKHETNLPMATIEKIFSSVMSLPKRYCTQKPPTQGDR